MILGDDIEGGDIILEGEHDMTPGGKEEMRSKRRERWE